MTGMFLTSVRYMYTHSTDSLPFDFQAFLSALAYLAEGGLPGGILGNGTSLE